MLGADAFERSRERDLGVIDGYDQADSHESL